MAWTFQKMNIIAFDIGGSKIDGALVINNKIKRFIRKNTESKSSKEAILREITGTIDLLMNNNVKGIGLGVPGIAENGRVVFMPNIKSLVGLDLRKFLEKRYNIKIVIENDAKCFVLGEFLYGKARGFSNVAGITLGTGVGSGFIFNKKLYLKYTELGHIIIKGENLPEEQLCSGPALVKTYELATKKKFKPQKKNLIYKKNILNKKIKKYFFFFFFFS